MNENPDKSPEDKQQTEAAENQSFIYSIVRFIQTLIRGIFNKENKKEQVNNNEFETISDISSLKNGDVIIDYLYSGNCYVVDGGMLIFSHMEYINKSFVLKRGSVKRSFDTIPKNVYIRIGTEGNLNSELIKKIIKQRSKKFGKI